MQVVPDSGWLGHARHRPVSPDTLVLLRLRSGLRALYQELLDEPLPEKLAVFVRQLEPESRARGPFAGEVFAAGRSK
jgi:hypothetical protein